MPWPLDADAPIPTAGELNRALSELRRQGNIYVHPPLKAFYGSFGWLLRLASASPVGTGITAIIQQSNGNVYAWQEAFFRGGVLVPKPGGKSSDTNADPAIEQNGQANIPPGTPVFLMRVFSKTFNKSRWIFYHQEHLPTSFVVNDFAMGYEGSSVTMS